MMDVPMFSTRSKVRFMLVLAATLFIAGSGIAYQRSESRALRLEWQEAKRVASEIAQLRTENERLKSGQIPAAELEQLRSDHAALPRLRAEVSELRKRVPAAAP